MAPGHIEAITLTNLDRLHPDAQRSLFWQMAKLPEQDPGEISADRVLGIPGPERRGGAREVEDRLLEKESWLNSVTYEWGLCGFTVSEDEFSPAVATVFFAPPLYMPTSRTMPAGPVSPDAVLLSSLHIHPEYLGLGYEGALITAVVHNLAARGVKAIEAFGCSGDGEDTETAADTGNLSFDATLDDDANPFAIQDSLDQAEAMIREFERAEARRGCAPGTLGDVGHGAGDVPQTRMLLNAGFTVVQPHQRHPRMRLELDGDWDWSAAVGEALDHLAATQIAEALLAQLNR